MALKRKEQVFVSHSQVDTEIAQSIKQAIELGRRTKAFLFEFEKYDYDYRANWQIIRDEIRKSMAVVLLVTRNLVQKRHTQNWIGFEVGVAAGSKPQKPVCLIKEQNINFPVPYVSIYIPISYTQMRKATDIGAPLDQLVSIGRDGYFRSVLRGREGDNPLPILSCPKCRIRFKMYPIFYREVRCPCCSAYVRWNPEPHQITDIEGGKHPPIDERQPGWEND